MHLNLFLIFNKVNVTFSAHLKDNSIFILNKEIWPLDPAIEAIQYSEMFLFQHKQEEDVNEDARLGFMPLDLRVRSMMNKNI